jgi:hypothetical protein
MLSVRQARTPRHRLFVEGGEQGRLQGWLQELVEQGWQVPINARSQAQGQAQGRATVEEEGWPRQEGSSDGQN